MECGAIPFSVTHSNDVNNMYSFFPKDIKAIDVLSFLLVLTNHREILLLQVFFFFNKVFFNFFFVDFFFCSEFCYTLK